MSWVRPDQEILPPFKVNAQFCDAGWVVVSQRLGRNLLVRDSNPGPLAPKARIIPLDQRAVVESTCQA